MKLTEMIFVNFNTTFDSYYGAELGSSNRFDFFFYRKEVSNEVVLTHRLQSEAISF